MRHDSLMSKFYLPLCLGLLLSGAALAAEGDSVMWRVDRSGTPPSFLLGTIHSDDSRVTGLSPAIEKVLRHTQTFVMELIPDFAAMSELGAAMRLPANKNLGDFLTPDLLRKAIAALAKKGVPRATVLRMRPWAVMANLSIPESNGGEFLDLVLYKKATANHKKTVGLETVAEQLDFLQGLPLAVKRDFIRQTLASEGGGKAEFEALLQAYLENDLAAVERLSNQQLEGVSKMSARIFRERGIWQRNARMLKRALPLFARGRVLVAVGALHLPAKRGLIHGLRQAGYSVTPVACVWSKGSLPQPVMRHGVATCPPS